MKIVRTMCGDIDPELLGVTFSHEHIVCVPPYWEELGETDFWLDDPEKSKREVELFKTAGGQSIIDATVTDYGRRAGDVGRISEATGIHVVGTTGFNKGILWPAKIPGENRTFAGWISESSAEALSDVFVHDIEVGMDGTKYPAGQIKYGTGYNSITDLEIKTIEAAVLAHRRTGAPVHAHLERGTMALEQINILKSLGFDLRYISFGHMDLNPDPYIHRKVAATGAYICFDGIGKVKYHPDSLVLDLIFALIKAGHGRQILVSGDTARRSYYNSYSQSRGWVYILTDWRDRLIEEANERGFDGGKIAADIFINNPKNCFSFKW